MAQIARINTQKLDETEIKAIVKIMTKNGTGGNYDIVEIDGELLISEV
jgi:hypothetical protein